MRKAIHFLEPEKHKMMNNLKQRRSLFLKSGLLITALALLGACSSTVPITPIPLTPLSTSSPVATVDVIQQAIQNFYGGLQMFNVDLTCTRPCWNSFELGKTSMPDIFKNGFGPKSSISRGSAGGPTAPDNAVGAGNPGVDIVAFSDDTQPTPLLRAIMFAPGNIVGLQPVTSIDGWQPNSILKRFGEPSEIVLANNADFYYILLDFKSQSLAVVYRGSKSYFPDKPDKLICLHDSPPGISIWVYGDKEMSGWSLILDVNNYKSVEGYNISPPRFLPATIITAPDQIAAITGPLIHGECISLNH